MSEQKKDVALFDADNNLPAWITENTGPTGFEELDSDYFSVPFLKLAQNNTPAVDQNSPDAIIGLKAGEFFVSTTREIIGPMVRVILLGVNRRYNVWQGEGSSAKLLNQLTEKEYRAIESTLHLNEKNKMVDKDGNRYADTRNHFVLLADHLDTGMIVYSLASSGLGVSKKLLTLATSVRTSKGIAPMFSKIWKLETKYITDPKGNYYQVSNIHDDGWIDNAKYPIIKDAFDLAQEKLRMVIKDSNEEDPINF